MKYGKKASDILIKHLIDWGVEIVFGLPVDGINGINGSRRIRQDEIRFIQVRHEEAAAIMACGDAKYTGSWAYAMQTSGPGAIHLLNGLSTTRRTSLVIKTREPLPGL